MYSYMYSGQCDYEYINILDNYIKKSNSHSGKISKINMMYEIPTIGRLKALHKGRYIYSQHYQKNNTKYEVCRDIYDDVDVVNCQSVLLQQIMEHHELDTEHIAIFNNDREKITKQLMNINKISRDKAKKIMYSFAFGQSSEDVINYKLKKYKLTRKTINYIDQMYDNRKMLLETYYKNLIEYGKKKKPNNPMGSAFSVLAQTAEKWVLLAMYQYFSRKNRKVGGLIHDGLHLEKHKNNNRYITHCEKSIKKQTGFSVKLKIKEFKKTSSSKKNKIRFNTIIEKDIKKMDIDYIQLNSQFLTKRGEDDKRGYDLVNKMKKNEFVFVKSVPGSGKTQFMYDTVKKFGSSIISLVSRITLSDMHTKELKIKNYRSVRKHGLNEVYQIDSLDRVRGYDKEEDYILILDEVASLCSHILNDMEKMSKHRLKFNAKLEEIINSKNCKLVIATDANINMGTLAFFKNIIDSKKIKLYHNKFVADIQTPVNIYYNKYEILGAIIKLIKKGENVFLCSNLNDTFRREFFLTILKETGLKEDEYRLRLLFVMVMNIYYIVLMMGRKQ